MDAKEESTRATNRKVIEQAFELISTDKASEVGPLLSDDLYFELPYGPKRQAVEVRGREPFIKMNAQTWPAFSRFALTITAAHEMLDPNKLILEYTSDGLIKATDKPYINRYVGIFGFRDGLICEWHEFHNPDVPAYAFSPNKK